MQIKATLETTAKEPITATTPGVVSPDMCGGSSLSCRRCGTRSPRAGGLTLRPFLDINDWRKVCTNLWTEKRMRLLPDGQTFGLSTRPSRPRCSLYACRGLFEPPSVAGLQEEAKRWILPSKRTQSWISCRIRPKSWNGEGCHKCFSATGPAPAPSK
jgi:hypothetical protein